MTLVGWLSYNTNMVETTTFELTDRLLAQLNSAVDADVANGRGVPPRLVDVLDRTEPGVLTLANFDPADCDETTLDDAQLVWLAYEYYFGYCGTARSGD